MHLIFSGSALMNIVGVYKEIQDQHMNIVCAFLFINVFFLFMRQAIYILNWLVLKQFTILDLT